jgi:hypothetical protein
MGVADVKLHAFWTSKLDAGDEYGSFTLGERSAGMH